MVKEAALKDVRASLRGAVLTPTDAGYDEVRRIHNGMFVRRPALIARCLGTADVIDAVRFARTHDLELAVRGGGHSVAGKSVCEGGLMLDLSLMKGIFVDPGRGTVRAQGGVTWGEFNRETQLHGLATTGGVVSTTGIAGLTLGGGLGWLMGKHGLAADNLIAAEVVTAAGEVVRASAEENRDLFWGLRGGGGNFGVVSWFEYRLHPVGPVTSGLVAHPIERARDVLRFFREVTEHDDLRPGLPPWREELLEVELPRGAQRRGDRRAHRAVRDLPLADERAGPRALPWGRHTRRRW
jgi:FAD/FMN-containing dehydrogenase